MQSLIPQSGTWRKVFRYTGSAAISTGIVVFVLDSASASYTGEWLLGITYAAAVTAVLNTIPRFILTFLIIKGYRDDPQRKETAGYLTMLREVNRR